MLPDRDLAKRGSASFSCAIVKDVSLCSSAPQSNTEALYLSVPENKFSCPARNDNTVNGSFCDLSPHCQAFPPKFSGYHRGIANQRIPGWNVGLSVCQIYGKAKEIVFPEAGGGWLHRILIPPFPGSNPGAPATKSLF